MTLSRRKTLAILGGGAIVAASGAGAYVATRRPQTALAPWDLAGGYDDPRKQALSYALLAPNPHNRQPWIVDLSDAGAVTLYADLDRLLPHTDPYSRQITIGLGCFLEVMRMAAAEQGYRVDIAAFPLGGDPLALDDRPVAHARFIADPAVPRDPLFAHVIARRSLKEPYDTTRPVAPDALMQIKTAAQNGMLSGDVSAEGIGWARNVFEEALRIEIETPHTYKESVDLFRIGAREVDANPDGIDFTGPMFESLRAAGLFTREVALDTSSIAYQSGLDVVFANCRTAMGHIWLVTPDNSRETQIAAGADWVRVNLAATGLGIGMQPMSQALQEYPEVAALYAEVHDRLAPQGGTVQMWARIGYGPQVAPSPRWPLEAKLV